MMPATRQEFADFFRRQGHRVIADSSSMWTSGHTWVYVRIPYHDNTALTEDYLDGLFRGRRCLAVRFAAPIRPMAARHGIFVCREREYGLPALNSKSRNQTRRGLENCAVRQVRPCELAGPRYGLVAETLARQNRSISGYSESDWHRLASAADKTPGFEAWIAEVEGRTVSMALTANIEGVYSILHQYSLSGSLNLYPNNALIFELTRTALHRPDVLFVSYGLRSLEDTAGLDRFKLHMGYGEEAWTQEVVFHPLAKPVLSSQCARRAVNLLARKFPASDVLRKGQAVLRAFDAPAPESPIEAEDMPLDVASIREVPAWDRERVVERIIDIHLLAFRNSFLTSLGRSVLRALYTHAIQESPDLCLLLYMRDRLIGLAVGIRNPRRFYRALLLSGWPILLSCMLANLKGAVLVAGRIRRALLYSLHQPFASNCKLISIAVDPGFQGNGGGGKLLDRFLSAAAPLGGAWLETDADDNPAANTLYSRHGMRAHSTIAAPSGKSRILYVSWGELQADPKAATPEYCCVAPAGLKSRAG